MPQKVYLNILKFGAYLSLVCIFFVFKGLLFPFITSKQIPFNMLIEILFVFWLAFIIKYPVFRPKKSYITYGLFGFFAVLIISCFTGVDFNLSFWGDVERMLGVFHILHFLVLYLIMITVFKTWKDWKTLFIISVILTVFVSLKGITGDTGYSTFGNTSYVSAFIIFQVYFCFILFFRERDKGLRWLYLISIPIMMLGFKKASTTGALVGLSFSIGVLFLMYAFLSKNKKIKIATLVLGLFIIVLFGVVLTHRDSDWVKSNSYLRQITEINVQKATFQTRLISWRAAAEDFKTHPILGTGHGNYAIIFDKYFDPHFYDYTSSETYFDRAHNNLVDIGSTTGVLGLLTYLFIFAAVAYYLFKGFRANKISLHEFILITCLIIAYFVQNLALFDAFVTYLALMMLLGYIYWLDVREDEDEMMENAKLAAGDYLALGGVIIMSLAALSQDKIQWLAKDNMRTLWLFMGVMAFYMVYSAAQGRKYEYQRSGDKPLVNSEIFTFVGAGLLICVIFWQYNIKPLKMLIGTIDGQRALARGNIEKVIDIYKEALSYNTVLDRDSRTSLNRSFASGPGALKKLDKQKAQEILDYNIELADLNVDYNQGDSLNQMLLAQILNTTASFNSGNQEKFGYYSGRALEAIDASIAASPGRIPIYYQKAQIYISRGEKEKAIETLKYAAGLNENYRQSFCHLAKTLLFYKDEDEAFPYMDQCIDKNGAQMLSPASFVKNLINHYAELKDWPRVIKLYERLTGIEPKNVKYYVDLAKLYAEVGEKEKAVTAAEKAGELDPGIRQFVEEFVEGLNK